MNDDDKKQLNILWLWPDILNLHGDRGNVMALVHVCELYGIEAEVTRVNRLTDDIPIEAADIIIMGAGELSVMPQIIKPLSNHTAELRRFAEDGGVLFATGTTGVVIGGETVRNTGNKFYGIELLDMECRERAEPLGDDLIFMTNGLGNEDTLPIYGIQIQMMDVSLAPDQQPFGEVIYGYGNNETLAEGAVYNNIIFSNALGPVLVKNPWLTLDLINRTMETPLIFDSGIFGLELMSAEAIRKFNKTKEKVK